MKNNKRKNHSSKFYLIIPYVLLLVICIGVSIPLNFNDHTYTITVTDKERTTSREDSKYLVFCEEDNGDTLVLENKDAFMRLKFDSSNIQGKLKEGKKYTIDVVGYRFKLFSMYENILRIKEVK